MRRVLIYAAVYGGIGAMVGALLALYIKDAPPSNIVLKNGSAIRSSKHSPDVVTPASTEVAEPSPIEENQ